MATIPTNTTVTLQRRSSSTTDSYGQNQGDYADVASYPAWVERTRYNEPQSDGSTDAADWLMLIPGQVVLNDYDRIVYEGDAYEVVAVPYTHRPPGGSLHHTEARMRPAFDTLRTQAFSTLVDLCIIEREGADTFNPGTGQIETGAKTTVYEGPCLVLARDAYNRETEVADDAVTLMSYSAVLPYDVDDVEDDDIFTATRSQDIRLQDRPLRITGVRMRSDLAARMLFLEDNLG